MKHHLLSVLYLVLALGVVPVLGLSACGKSGAVDESTDADVTGDDASTTDDATETSDPGCDPARLGEACGVCGEVICVEDEEVCDDPGANACGGCGELDHAPGEACDPGDGVEGEWRCDGGTGELVCVPVTDTGNACGGTGELEGEPGEACGCGGEWACAGTEDVTCEGAEPENACGGCEPLQRQPNAPCGCGDGRWECEDGGLVCTSPTANVCGGCAELDGEPGDACSTSCGDGLLRCSRSGERLRCYVDGEFANACGGCEPLEGSPGDPCGGECGPGELVCDEEDG